MLRGELVGLRARIDDDVPILHEELYEDVETRMRADSRPWRPIPVDASPYAVGEPNDEIAIFSVVLLADNTLVGDALLWDIDVHNRTAHLGMSLRPTMRGRGLGTDVVRVLCRYGFETRGLHRLQIETLADNVPMLRAGTKVGFTHDGTLRGAAWVNGQFVDEVVLGLLAEEWKR